MKIAFFTDSYLDLTGGIVTSIDAQKEALEKLGHTVYLFSTGYSRSKAERDKLAKDHVFVVPTCKLFFRGLTPISRRPKIIEKWILKNYPEVKDFDIFHVHYESGCSIAGVRLGHQLKIPVVQTMHGREDMGLNGIFPFGMRSFIAMHLNRFHNLYLPHDVNIKKDHDLAPTYARGRMWTLMVNHANAADVVLTPSEHFKQKLKKYGVRVPIRVVPNAVLDDEIPEKCSVKTLKKGEPLHLIWHSRLSSEKRIMEFLEALKYVKGKYLVDFYGEGALEVAAKTYAKAHKLKVKFHGVDSLENLIKTMDACHLDVMTSYNFDTFAMTLIEAESVGLPVIFCDPDMKEVIPDGGYVFADGIEPTDIAAAINHVIENPEEIEKMSKIMVANRDDVRQSRRILKLLDIYDKIRS